ncbi:MAG TPA: SusD/RagB family nutrient-binding outer membrane lipoprotein [Bacteroidales bacterium]|nr:SusD/RagB family nutrient-binding outer membrane lipoprotein [Bacteroidales bacterium]HRX97344.1 SusD/RagB family nutrient-binding outer membrane lipoprotein [Bacteroidales bacterium]
MKRIYWIFIVLIGISVSCTKDFEDFNTDQKNPVAVPGDFVFANAQKALADQVASTNVNQNIWKLVAQYWTETTYTDESNYDIVTRTIPDIIFRTYYRDVLNDLKDARTVIAGEAAIGDEAAGAKANKLLIIDLVNAYTYNRMVDIFGNIPYTEALDIDNIAPAYDDAYAIYQSLFDKIDNAIANLNAGYGSFGSNDLYFGGDVSMWIKFAHSLKIKMAITIADFSNGTAQSIIEGSYDKGFAPGEICELVYPGGSNSNPLYVDLVQSGRHDFVPANTLVDKMNALEDPRRASYFTMYEGEYVGGIYGESNNWSNFSHIADPIQEATFPITLLDGVETYFYLAEAAARNYSVGMTAAEYYNAAITGSFEFWGLTSDDAAAYIAKPEVAYDGANWKQSIGEQSWLAFYVRGLVAWNNWRRLDYPVLNLPPAPETDDGQIPKRFTYPVNEQTLNKDNYYSAGDAIGGDLMSTKLFWDKN